MIAGLNQRNNSNCSFGTSALIIIGDNVAFGPEVRVLSRVHDYEKENMRSGEYSGKKLLSNREVG